MKERYRIIQRSDRGGGCYCVDTQTGERSSLGTRDRQEAKRLVQHRNEALKNPHINRKIGMPYCPDIHAYGIVRRLLGNNSGAVRPSAGGSQLSPRREVDRIWVG